MILKSELLPHPLGPLISKCIPVVTFNDKDGTTMSQLGVTMGTLSREAQIFYPAPINYLHLPKLYIKGYVKHYLHFPKL